MKIQKKKYIYVIKINPSNFYDFLWLVIYSNLDGKRKNDDANIFFYYSVHEINRRINISYSCQAKYE